MAGATEIKRPSPHAKALGTGWAWHALISLLATAIGHRTCVNFMNERNKPDKVKLPAIIFILICEHVIMFYQFGHEFTALDEKGELFLCYGRTISIRIHDVENTRKLSFDFRALAVVI